MHWPSSDSSLGLSPGHLKKRSEEPMEKKHEEKCPKPSCIVTFGGEYHRFHRRDKKSRGGRRSDIAIQGSENRQLQFRTGELTVPVGTTVTWTNRDDIPHTVVSTDKVFKSKVLDTDEKFSFTFSKAGTYPYFCSIHPKMTGKVVVQ